MFSLGVQPVLATPILRNRERERDGDAFFDQLWHVHLTVFWKKNRLNSKNRFFWLVLKPEIWPLLFFGIIIKEITPSKNELSVSSPSICFYLEMSHSFTSKDKSAGPIRGIWHAMPPGWSIRHFVFFLRRKPILSFYNWACHRQPNN